jgi:predicted choloylglycine hydrolase
MKNIRWGKIFKWAVVLIIIAFVLAAMVFDFATRIEAPVVKDMSVLTLQRVKKANDFYLVDNNMLRKNRYGLWEMYLEGKPFDMGVASGKLTKELIEIQENAFVEQINKMIPSKFYLHFLKYFIAWFDRDIDQYIPEEYKKEIYGISLSCSDKYNFIAPPYQRMLNYHGAHDIGHALTDLAMVGCTSFGVNKGQQSDDLMVGRNFDFYINDDFAKNKIVAFVNPDEGYKFVYVTWASMIGVVSGMNEKGLTVTINAAKSDIPTKAATPISILARYILQHAQNIAEARKIANNFQTFVSESVLIGSAQDDDVAIIEKSPSKTGFFTTDTHFIVCANHYQSAAFAHDPKNISNLKTSPSLYREKRCKQLIRNAEKTGAFEQEQAAAVLRDKTGLNGKNIGLGNEKAMCQLISHHSVIFKPKQLKIWVSTNPWQLGNYICYDLNKVFKNVKSLTPGRPLDEPGLVINKDPFLDSQSYFGFLKFKKLKSKVMQSIRSKKKLTDEQNILFGMLNANPDYYLGYKLAGDYYYTFDNPEKSLSFYKMSLTKEYENTNTKDEVIKRMKKLENKTVVKTD